MLLGGHLAGDENAEMADALVQRINDRLTIRDDLVDAVIQVEDPIERLLRRRDVVAERAEHDDRRADFTQVNTAAIAGSELACVELVADEQFFDDELHLLGVQQNRSAPPFLEFEKPFGLGVDVGVDVVGLLP